MKSNTISLIVITLVIAGGVYWYFSSSSGNQLPLTASTAVSNPAQEHFQSLVSKLQSISFDTSIFSDARFTALVDLSTPVTPEASGRLDPFATISAAAAAAASH